MAVDPQQRNRTGRAFTQVDALPAWAGLGRDFKLAGDAAPYKAGSYFEGPSATSGEYGTGWHRYIEKADLPASPSITVRQPLQQFNRGRNSASYTVPGNTETVLPLPTSFLAEIPELSYSATTFQIKNNAAYAVRVNAMVYGYWNVATTAGRPQYVAAKLRNSAGSLLAYVGLTDDGTEAVANKSHLGNQPTTLGAGDTLELVAYHDDRTGLGAVKDLALVDAGLWLWRMEYDSIKGDAGRGYGGVSSTSNSIANSGTLTFVVEKGLAYNAASRVRFSANAANYTEGVVNSYTENANTATLVMTPDTSLGSGTYSSWTHSLIGNPGGGSAGADIHITADYTVPLGVNMVWCDNPGPITVTLPDAASTPRRRICIKRRNTGAVTVIGPLDGLASLTIDNRWHSIDVQSAGDEWGIL